MSSLFKLTLNGLLPSAGRIDRRMSPIGAATLDDGEAGKRSGSRSPDRATFRFLAHAAAAFRKFRCRMKLPSNINRAWLKKPEHECVGATVPRKPLINQ